MALSLSQCVFKDVMTRCVCRWREGECFTACVCVFVPVTKTLQVWAGLACDVYEGNKQPGSVSLTQTHTPRGERDESERSGKAATISSPVEGVTVKYVVAGISVHSCLMLSVLGCFSALFNF